MSLYKLTQEQLESIHCRLKAWKESNEISLEMSRKGVVANLLEELTEHRRAYTSNDDIQMLDAKCDLIVFAMNAIDVLPNLEDTVYNSIDYERVEFEASIALCIYYILQAENPRYNSMAGSMDYDLCRIIVRCINGIHESGFDVVRAMEETVKQISSRSGRMDRSIGKWVKDKSPEAKAREYKADYESCRL